MPDSRPLILKRVCRMPVVAPAIAPAPNAAAVATSGCTCATSSTPVTAAPSVIDPSAVMSGNAKIRKLMKTPNASSDRMRPIVNAPMSSSMLRDLRQPARAADELGFTRTRRAAIVVQQMHHAHQLIRLEQPGDGVTQLDESLLNRPEPEGRRVQMADRRGA